MSQVTETAFQQITKKVYIIWEKEKKKIVSLLLLNVFKTFNRVSHVQLIHNLKKKESQIHSYDE